MVGKSCKEQGCMIIRDKRDVWFVGFGGCGFESFYV